MIRFMVTYQGNKGERQINGAFPIQMPDNRTFPAVRRAVESLRSLEIKATKMSLELWNR
jgi:hypothetical protein